MHNVVLPYFSYKSAVKISNIELSLNYVLELHIRLNVRNACSRLSGFRFCLFPELNKKVF